MQFFPTPQLILSIGPLHVTWYAALLLTGILLSYWLSRRTLLRWGYAPSAIDDLVIPLVFWALVGARLYYVIFQWDYYSQHLDQIIAIWNGGIAMHGSIIGACAYGLWYCHKHHFSFMRFADAILPNVFVGQAIGRWGNFMNQEAFGNIVDPSFYNGWPAFIKDRMFIDGAYRFPSFLVESVLDLAGWIFITFVFRKYFYRRRGDCAYMYCIWYGAIRLVLETQRTDALLLFGVFRQAQLISAVLILTGILGLSGVFARIYHHYFPRQKPLVLFDLDGTLIDSKELIFETFKRVFAIKLPDHKLSAQELQSFFGPTLEQTFERYTTPEQVQEWCDLYQKINRDLYDGYVKQIPGVKETLESLKQEGYQFGVVSNKRIAVVKKGLEQAGLLSLMDVVLGKEDLARVKPAPDGLLQAADLMHADYGNIIYVGDTPGDIQAAKAMAAYSIGFSPDQSQLELLEKENPRRIMKNFNELKQILSEDREWNDSTIW